MRNFLTGILLALLIPCVALLFLLLLARWQHEVMRIEQETSPPSPCYEVKKEVNMAFNAKQFRECIVRPALKELDPIIPYSKSAENLLMGTAAQESHLGTYLKQLRGPALGIYQMEPRTHNDIWDNFIDYDDKGLVLTVGEYGQRPDNLVENLIYATMMARLHYWRVKEPLPFTNDIDGHARYWKQYYNTPKGKGKVAEFKRNYKRYVG